MIKNEELYDFQAEPNTTGPDTEPTPSAEPESRFPSKFLYQTIVSICCLILLLAVSSSQSPWLQWVGARIHSAVNTSMEDTFGRLSQSGFVRRLITNAGNLVRLEEITKTLSNQELGNPEATMFQRTVWPVQGSIIKGYGWRYNSANKTREFNSGVEITALPDAPVLAIADGTVSKIIHDPEDGWEIVLKHDEGWTSNY
ncbi:MAG: M23 family metallopeptidase, partial [Bacillota bacterium]